MPLKISGSHRAKQSVVTSSIFISLALVPSAPTATRDVVTEFIKRHLREAQSCGEKKKKKVSTNLCCGLSFSTVNSSSPKPLWKASDMWLVLQMCQHSSHAGHTQYILPARQKSDPETRGTPTDSACNCCRGEAKNSTEEAQGSGINLLHNSVAESVIALAVLKIRMSQSLIKHKRGQYKL